MIVLGSHNRHKGIEMNEILAPLGIQLKTLADFPNAIDVMEDGHSFRENAEKKAVEQARNLNCWVVAEDSGISVPVLNGEPGIYSARFAGPHATDEQNNDLLLKKLGDLPLEKREAYYTCFMVLSDPEGKIQFAGEGKCWGTILYERHGSNGFGYDPLFKVRGYDYTFGELPSDIKSRISHRAQATQLFIAWIKDHRELFS
ncbi:MAG: RdgB/HAM1 family non-canonical purine NTP pyrophosphatase [Planctomycetia bacterium]|nr:RdgB/HAM1 family non-canonical purine NTP pyrophosphatase [Planctomycetia bacterium]